VWGRGGQNKWLVSSQCGDGGSESFWGVGGLGQSQNGLLLCSEPEKFKVRFVHLTEDTRGVIDVRI